MLPQSLNQVRKWNRQWIWTDVIGPMVAIRLALLLVGWLSQTILPNPNYPTQEAIARGWHFSQSRLLDMWARWDAGWYLSIVQAGYFTNGDIQATQSNIAFFPLYPYLIKLFVLLLPERLRTPERILIIALVISNLLLIAALILLHKLIADFSDRALAQRTILYLLLFPTGFILFCFYTESAFLFLSVAAFYAASKKSWGLACLFGSLLSLTRPLGVLIIIPLIWMYLESVEWKPLKIQKSVLWFSLIPLGLLFFLLYAHHLTGDYLAPIHAQKAWQKTFAMPWTTLFHSVGGDLQITHVEQILTILFIALGILSLFKLPSMSYGIYSLLLILPPLTSGTLISTSRYYVVVFPAFIVMALLGKRAILDNLFKLVFFALQILFIIAWTRFYWVA
ncbi:MAG: hypothetical protein WCB68_18440 [Pyrinomonadaceae bacterium]